MDLNRCYSLRGHSFRKWYKKFTAARATAFISRKSVHPELKFLFLSKQLQVLVLYVVTTYLLLVSVRLLHLLLFLSKAESGSV